MLKQFNASSRVIKLRSSNKLKRQMSLLRVKSKPNHNLTIIKILKNKKWSIELRFIISIFVPKYLIEPSLLASHFSQFFALKPFFEEVQKILLGSISDYHSLAWFLSSTKLVIQYSPSRGEWRTEVKDKKENFKIVLTI